ncbi:UDP-N-acetylglucosamine 2-epimerase (hydrolyzing) [Macrococcoides goetzii]|nr:UDP-N-acetylglucosamine 2-epimerase [Macrococcus goetzii]TDM46080.1 UDP-N-acetylglucosamine 2-epimerase (hydrolyzing) [Macrococcus goetzii]
MKISVVTGTRAEYGLLKPLLNLLENHQDIDFTLIVTGMHLAPEFGETINEIISDGFDTTEKVELLLSSDSDIGVAKAMGLGMISFSETLSRINPDLLILLGDRFEVFSAATAASVLKIPIAHIHGGEKTEGAFDESFRHSITKMSQLHFTSTEEYRNRVIQLGESPDRVFNVGALGVENILNLKLLDKKEIFDEIGLDLHDEFFLVTFHPTTLEKENPEKQIKDLLETLLIFSDYKIVIAKANSDTNGRKINQVISEYNKKYDRIITFYSLGILKYLSLMKRAKLVVGNSSSGIIEAPNFNIPTINLGDRQKGRVRANSVIDSEVDKESIAKAVKRGLEYNFTKYRNDILYGDGTTSSKILNTILNYELNDESLKKEFFDMEVNFD